MIDPAFEILNQRGTPMFFSDVFANRPTAGIVGRIFISTDTKEFYRDTGTTWELIGGPGTGTITGSGAANQVAFWDSASSITGENNLWWDATNNYLGINTNTPSVPLDVHHSGNNGAILNQTTGTNNNLIAFQTSGNGRWRIGNFYNAGADDYGIFDVIGNIQPFTIAKTSGQTFIGSKITASGRLVVNSASSDAHIQVVGANAPSVRIDNLGSGATQRFVMGLATATNNFIQGATAGDICISTASASPLLFGMWQSINASEVMRITTSNNVSIGYNIDLGYKLYVNGAIGTNGSITIGSGGSGTSYLYALSGSDLILNAGGDRVTIRQTGNVIINNLSGSGTRMVVADANGVLSTQAIGSGSITGSGTTSYIPKFTGSSSIGNSIIYDSGSAIGIGTTTPATQLELIGNYRQKALVGNSNGFNISINSSTDVVSLTNFYNAALTFGQNNVEAMRLTSTGLGIKTTNPKTILQSTGAAQTTSPTLGSATGGALYLTSTDTDYGTLFGISGTGLGWIQQQRTDGTATSYAFSLQPSGGNVLIGTTTDSGFKLDVNGVIYSNNQVRIVTSAGGVSGYFTDATNSTLQIKHAAGSLQFLNGSNIAWLREDGSGAVTFSSTINMTGGLTMNPVNSSLYATDGALSYYATNNAVYLNGAGPSGWLTLNASGVETGRNSILLFGSTASTPDQIRFKTANADKMILASTGNLLIGTTTDAGQKLQVNGTGYFAGNVTLQASSTTLVLNRTGGTTFGTGIGFQTSGTNNWIIGTAQASVGTDFSIYNYGIGGGALNITYGNNNIQIGSTTDDGEKLKVVGTSRFTTFMGVGTGPDASTMIYVKGADTSSTNFAAVFQNSAGTNLVRFFNNGKVNMSALPTSSAGLSAGDIWNDAGTLKIV